MSNLTMALLRDAYGFGIALITAGLVGNGSNTLLMLVGAVMMGVGATGWRGEERR